MNGRMRSSVMHIHAEVICRVNVMLGQQGHDLPYTPETSHSRQEIVTEPCRASSE